MNRSIRVLRFMLCEPRLSRLRVAVRPSQLAGFVLSFGRLLLALFSGIELLPVLFGKSLELVGNVRMILNHIHALVRIGFHVI